MIELYLLIFVAGGIVMSSLSYMGKKTLDERYKSGKLDTLTEDHVIDARNVDSFNDAEFEDRAKSAANEKIKE